MLLPRGHQLVANTSAGRCSYNPLRHQACFLQEFIDTISATTPSDDLADWSLKDTVLPLAGDTSDADNAMSEESHSEAALPQSCDTIMETGSDSMLPFLHHSHLGASADNDDEANVDLLSQGRYRSRRLACTYRGH